jgi:hypothetical protein
MPFAFLFATPGMALLVGAAAAAVPVVIHLLNRKRYRVVPWAAMRFLLAAQKHNSRRLRLEQWLLLAIRTLLVLLVVAAMCSVMPWAEAVWQRVLPGEVPGASTRPTTQHVLVLDASFSMGVVRDGKNLFEHARQSAAEIVRSAGPGDGVSVVVMGKPARTLVRGPAHDPAKVLPALMDKDLQVSHTDADLPGALDEVTKLLDRGRGRFARREVVFLTDLQRATWAPPAAEATAKPADPAKPDAAASAGSKLDELWRKVGRGARLAFVDVGRPGIDNLAVTGLALADPLVTAGTTANVTATVRNFGAQPRKVGVELLVGRARGSAPSARADATPTGDPAVDDPACSPVPVDRKLVELPAGGAAVPVPFAHAFDAPGEYVVQARLDGDALEVDNQRALVVPVKDRTLPVWLIDRNPDPKPGAKPPPTAVYDLAKVLNPGWEPGGPSRFGPDNPLRPEELTEEQFAAGTRGDPRPDECVFVCDVPALSKRSVERLEAHLRRGGSVVFCLGPMADRKAYNRDLYRDGDGLLPASLGEWVKAPEEEPFTLDADEEEFARPPLVEFADNYRPGLLHVRFRHYVRLQLPEDSPARTVLSFKKPTPPGAPPPAAPVKRDPAVLLARCYQGQVAVIASHGEPDGTSRVLPPRWAEFVHELLRDLVQGRPRGQTVGQKVELVLPSSHAGLEAVLHKLEPPGRPKPANAPPEPKAEAAAKDGAGWVSFPAPAQSGLYRVTVGALPREYLFAVNVPVAADEQRMESDLRRTDKAGLQRLAPLAELMVTTDPGQVLREPPRARPGEPEAAAEPPPRGPGIARLLLLLVLILAAAETVLAWRLGSARSAAPGAEFVSAGDEPTGSPRRSRRRDRLGWLALVPLAGLVLVAGVLIHESVSGELFGFLPANWQRSVEDALGVPAPAPGEGTRWHLERLPFLTDTPRSDRWPAGALALLLAGLALAIYACERSDLIRVGSDPPRHFVGPAALRVGLFLLLVGVFLPQLQLAFQREEWPDLVLLFDDSKSMATADDSYTDPRLRAAVERLAKLCPPNELPPRCRLQLAKTLVTRGEGDWLTRLLEKKQVKVHVYHCSQGCDRLAEADDPVGRERLRERVGRLAATGPESRLGSAVRKVLEEFRGGSLAAVVMFTDGVSTDTATDEESRGEDDLVAAAKVAHDAGVPLYFVGLGDARQPRELQLDLAELPDVVLLRDRLVFRGRLTGRGDGLPDSVPVVLSEKVPGEARPRELARQTVRVPGGGQEVEFRLTHTPESAGEKNYIIEADLGPPEERQRLQITTAALERTVVVTEFQQLRVLYVEGSPRYEFRFVKALLERETAALRGGKAVDLRVLLLDADPGYAKEDRSALADFPTREELFGYHAVFLGDVDPAKLGDRNQQLLVEFVRERGGGLLMIAGEQFSPHAYRDGPLAAVLPVAFDVDRPAAEAPADPAGYRPKLTPDGKDSPLFQFGPDEAASAAVWEKLRPMLWSAGGYRAKRGATVLAVHPNRPALAPVGGSADAKAGFPLVLRQLVGGGRVLFYGFDETWRWRFREFEPYFNQFWMQTVRELALAPFKRPRLRTDQEKPYRVGGKVKLTAELFDAAPPPGRPVAVKVRHHPPAKPGAPPPPPSERSVALERRGGGTFEGTLTADQPGNYEFALESPALVPAPKASATVLPPVGETDPDRLRQNEAGLRRAAAEAHGKYYTLADADALPDQLPAAARVPLEQAGPPYRLWNQPALFALALGLVAVEWVLRKRRRLL